MADRIINIDDLRILASKQLFAKLITGMFKEWFARGDVKIIKTPNYLYPHYHFEVPFGCPEGVEWSYKIYASVSEKRGINHSVKINTGFVGGERREVSFVDYPTDEGGYYSRGGAEIAKSVYEMTVRKYNAQQKLLARQK